MQTIIAPSILAADFAYMGRDAQRAEQGGGDWLHCDVMDGHFVPNISFGPAMVAALHRSTRLPLDVHLMVEHPDQYVEVFAKAGAHRLTIHLEAMGNKKDGTEGRAVFQARDNQADTGCCASILRVLQTIQKLGCRAGLSVNPSTPASAVAPYLEWVDLVLVMTVWPGFGGQKFMPEMLEKMREVRNWAEHQERPVFVEVDGGIDEVTAPLCAAAGANAFVAGTSLYRHENLKEAIASLRRVISEAR